jgi:site-specific DNA recombinase
MNRTAIYARYSSDSQRPSSIIDQQRRCGRYADESSLQVIASFADEAEGGWKRDRPQYQAMLAAAKRREFDVLLVDDLSRLFRDAGEQNDVLRRFDILDIRVVGVAEGWDSRAPGAKLMAGFKGIMNEQYLEAIAMQTHRGLEGRVNEGFSAGGSVYGYRTEAVEASGRLIGHRRLIVEAEADVVRSIYQQYVEGLSPARIAENLNSLGVKAPRGNYWSRNAIYGDRRDCSGILCNPIYRGEIVWNRSTFIRDPETGGRVKKRNAAEDWVRTPAPELRIVPEELCEQVKARMASTAARSEAIREGMGASARTGAEGRYMLTGLLKCSMCGGPISTAGPNLFGCSVRHNRGDQACKNDVKFRRDKTEGTLLDVVRSQLFTTAAIERYTQLLAEELATQSDSGEDVAATLTKALSETDKAIAGCMAFIEAGNTSPTVATRLATHERKAQELRDALARHEEARCFTTTDFDELKSAGLSALENLPALLNGAEAQTRAVLAQLLGPTTVTPAADKQTLEIKMAGQLTGLLSIPAIKQRKTARLVNVVAGAGFEPTTFGL